MYVDICMMVERERNVCIVFNIFKIICCKVFWIEFFWVVLVVIMMMKNISVYYDVCFGGNVEVVYDYVFVCYVCNCWFWRM